MRPKQWFKSFYIVIGSVPAIFSMSVKFDLLLIFLFAGILNMILLQGVMYIMNDIADAEKDMLHPKKKNRPIASGKISVREAVVFGVLLFFLAIALAAFLDFKIVLIDFALLLNNILYSFWPLRLRDIQYIDIGSVALNFPLRVMVGWYLFDSYTQTQLNLFVPIILLTYFSAVFLLSFKRVAEKLNLKNAEKFRKPFKYYSTMKLKSIAMFSATMVLISFILFAWNLKPTLLILCPFLFFAMCWYSRLAFLKNSVVMAPEDIFIKMPKFTLMLIILCLFALVILLL